MRRILKYLCLFAVAFLIILPTPTYAYLDPGAGSYLFQILAALIFTSLFIFKSWWRKASTFIQELIHRKGDQDEPTSEKPERKR